MGDVRVRLAHHRDHASTAWGVSTSRATGDSESLGPRSLQRSRELVVEPSELQRLPATAMIVSHGVGAGRRVLLADANPAIGGLPVATLAALAESPGAPAGPDATDPVAARPVPVPCRLGRAGRTRRPGRTGAPATRRRATRRRATRGSVSRISLTGPSRHCGPTPAAGCR